MKQHHTYGRHLIRAMMLCNDKFLESDVSLDPVQKEVYLNLNKTLNDVKKSSPDDIAEKVKAFKEGVIKVSELLKDADEKKKLLEDVQNEMIAFMRTAYPSRYNIGNYEKTSKKEANSKAGKTLIQEPEKTISEQFEQTAQTIIDYNDMMKNGKAGNLPGVSSGSVQITKTGEDSHGNPIYQVNSKNPKDFMHTCIRLDKREITVNNYNDSNFFGILRKDGKNDSQRFIDDMLKVANTNLYYVNIKVKDTEEKTHYINDMKKRLSSEGQYRLNVNNALKAGDNINDVYEKTIFVYDNLNKKDAKKFLDEQLDLHKNDPSYQDYRHRLIIEAMKSEAKQPGSFERFCKNLYKETELDPVKKAQNECQAYHENLFTEQESERGLIYQDLDHLNLQLKSIQDNHPEEEYRNLREEYNNLQKDVDNLKESICLLGRSPENKDILEDWAKIQMFQENLALSQNKAGEEMLKRNEGVDLLIEPENPVSLLIEPTKNKI